MRKIAVIIGSDSDLPQCLKGLKYLERAVKKGLIYQPWILTASIHRNTEEVLKCLRALSGRADIIIAGAGWANHLTGTCDAFLRYALADDKTGVIGVAFEDPDNPEHTEAAIASIKHVPGTQVMFDDFVGEKGFFTACKFAVKCVLPKIKLKEGKPVIERTLAEAIKAAKEKRRG